MADTYAAPDLLADTAWLAEHLGDPGMVIVEMGTKAEEFEAGHIPGAVRCPSAQIKGTGDADPRLVAPPAEAKALFESLGVGGDTLVVAYDRIRNRDASRLWWVLGYYGHANVRVLNGGWKKWTAEGRPAEPGHGASGPGAPSGSATFTPAVHAETASTVEKLTAAIGEPGTVIWDIRTPEEFSGEADRGNARKGHVPGAVHLEWVDLVNDDDTFKDAGELRALAAGLGITPETAVHVY
ncbi:MAG: sulfurtransferase [Chloroflexi bacterium]|nr:sulfurtransferase [Chloroflexota bacterium]